MAREWIAVLGAGASLQMRDLVELQAHHGGPASPRPILAGGVKHPRLLLIDGGGACMLLESHACHLTGGWNHGQVL
jgi:hypothetical protein